MSRIWTKKEIKNTKIAPREGIYEVIPQTIKEENMKKIHPEIFKFKAISVGDDRGQAFFVPLDENSRKTAEYILRAIAAYKGE